MCELTKLHEEVVRRDLRELSAQFSGTAAKGEIVIVIDRARKDDAPKTETRSLAERVREIESGGIDHKTALKTAAKEFGLSRSEAYRILQNSK